ncbi:unnamed protein product [Cyprideis torosa]|uniref:Uncharacterized protein n=1 Tax=Cyprideis torosa TaxID=163714 RepID=A0A7R8W1P9_9CRUS|nr:unnamed protein product [Cyprideis torosa]CAG0881173.1 unnamed protein product [Cyprideis torosa]
MPLRRQPRSLKVATILAITDKFEMVCYGVPSAQLVYPLFHNDEFVMNFQSVFHELPSELIDEMLEIAKEHRHLARHMLVPLLTPMTRKLYLSHGIAEIHNAVVDIPIRSSGIVHLDLSYLMELSPMAIEVLISGLPHLRILCLKKTLSVDKVFEILESSLCEMTQRTFALAVLKSTDEDVISPQALQLALDTCPNITKVVLSNEGLTNPDIIRLASCGNLTHLSLTIAQEGSGPITFTESVIPVLQARGHKLRDLILCHFPVIDLEQIAINCPSLQNLALAGTGRFTGSASSDTESFKNLQALELWAAESEDGTEERRSLKSSEVIEILLRNCHQIRNILINNFEDCDDTLFLRIMEVLKNRNARPHILLNEF